jgi:spore maturation protein CgeB
MRSLLPPLLRRGSEVVTFADAGELRELVQYWLARPEERAAIAAAGRARVLAEHTYRHRMETLLEAVCARDSDRLRARVRRPPTVADAALAEGDTSFGRFLGGLPAATPFTLNGVAGALAKREGRLTDPENILLFLHQFDELYLREHRQ